MISTILYETVQSIFSKLDIHCEVMDCFFEKLSHREMFYFHLELRLLFDIDIPYDQIGSLDSIGMYLDEHNIQLKD